MVGNNYEWMVIFFPHLCISDELLSVEAVICTEFLPTISGRAPPGDLEHDLLALPAQLGGIAVPSPAKISDKDFITSQSITELLIDLILSNDLTLPREAILKLSALKK